jgi:hypothetical protein
MLPNKLFWPPGAKFSKTLLFEDAHSYLQVELKITRTNDEKWMRSKLFSSFSDAYLKTIFYA